MGSYSFVIVSLQQILWAQDLYYFTSTTSVPCIFIISLILSFILFDITKRFWHPSIVWHQQLETFEEVTWPAKILAGVIIGMIITVPLHFTKYFVSNQNKVFWCRSFHYASTWPIWNITNITEHVSEYPDVIWCKLITIINDDGVTMENKTDIIRESSKSQNSNAASSSYPWQLYHSQWGKHHHHHHHHHRDNHYRHH